MLDVKTVSGDNIKNIREKAKALPQENTPVVLARPTKVSAIDVTSRNFTFDGKKILNVIVNSSDENRCNVSPLLISTYNYTFYNNTKLLLEDETFVDI